MVNSIVKEKLLGVFLHGKTTYSEKELFHVIHEKFPSYF
jgi:hypothetical protein